MMLKFHKGLYGSSCCHKHETSLPYEHTKMLESSLIRTGQDRSTTDSMYLAYAACMYMCHACIACMCDYIPTCIHT